MSSNHLILSCPLLLLPSVFPSIRVFSNESALHIRWPKYWSFSISPSNNYSGWISFRIDWFDFFAVQGTLKSSPAPQFKSTVQKFFPSTPCFSVFYRFSLKSIILTMKNCILRTSLEVHWLGFHVSITGAGVHSLGGN